MSDKKKKTTKKVASKTKDETAPETKAANGAKPKKEKAPKEADLMTFAFRVPKSESAALHRAAGPGRASRVMRSLASAYVKGDRALFESIVVTVREPRQ